MMRRRELLAAAPVLWARSAQPDPNDLCSDKVIGFERLQRRRARVATINTTVHNPSDSCNPERNANFKEDLARDFLEDGLVYHERMFEKAGELGCDIVAAAEDMNRVSGAEVMFRKQGQAVAHARAVEIPGPVTERLGEIARRRRMYIVAPLIERQGGRLYNTAALIGRDGKLVGIYRKTHPVTSEKHYVTPGDNYPVFDLDFGRVGFLICWDMHFPEIMRIYGLKGADLVIWPSATIGWNPDIGIATLRARASDNSLHVAASIYNRPRAGHSCIVDYQGNVLMDVGLQEDAIAWADIDFAKPRPDDVPRRLLRDRRPQTFGLLLDPNPPASRRYGL